LNLRTLLLALLIAAPAAAQASDLKMAITVDDLPVHGALPPGETHVSVAKAFLTALNAAGAAPVYGFINGVQNERVPGAAPVLTLWREAGHPLGNHGWSHLGLDGIDVATFASELDRNDAVLAQLAGDTDFRWFRFPFLNEGTTPAKRAGAREVLKARGYHIASVTVSFGDYAWNEPYARCMARGDTDAVADLEASFLQAARDSLTYSRTMSAQLYGEDIPYVLLLHLGAFDARIAPRMLALYQSMGVKLVSLQEAQSHPFYKADVEAAPSPAPASLESAMFARGLPLPARSWDLAALDKVCR